MFEIARRWATSSWSYAPQWLCVVASRGTTASAEPSLPQPPLPSPPP